MEANFNSERLFNEDGSIKESRGRLYPKKVLQPKTQNQKNHDHLLKGKNLYDVFGDKTVEGEKHQIQILNTLINIYFFNQREKFQIGKIKYKGEDKNETGE